MPAKADPEVRVTGYVACYRGAYKMIGVSMEHDGHLMRTVKQ